MVHTTREVTAKFKVTGVSPPWGLAEHQEVSIDLSPDYNDGRNKEWAEYTPNGAIKLTVKEEVAKHFPLGQAFTVTFTPEDEEGEQA